MAAATGTAPLTYQWTGPAGLILNATNSSLTLTNLAGSDSGPYSVGVTNGVGGTNSSDAILVVDDSTQRAQGLLIYESRRPPEGYPSIGALTGADRTIPLYGVRVDWANVSNPKCPLLGAPAGPPSSAQLAASWP